MAAPSQLPRRRPLRAAAPPIRRPGPAPRDDHQPTRWPRRGAPTLDLDGEFALLVEALWAAETGEPEVPLPYHTICWFLDRAHRFRGSAPYAALKLIQRIVAAAVDEDREEMRARAATATAPFVERYPERVEELLLELAEESDRGVHAAVLEAAIALLGAADDPGPIVERWLDHSDGAGEIIGCAAALLGLCGGRAAADSAG